jgi:PAS domain S-box-containing protein
MPGRRSPSPASPPGRPRDPQGSAGAREASISPSAEAERAREALRLSESALHEQARILEHAQVMVRDLDGRITMWGAGSVRMYGWSREEALGRISHELLRTQFPVPLESIRERLDREGVWEGEVVQQRKDGSTIAVASQWILDRDEAGRPRAVLVVNNDITRLRLAEASRRESDAQLRAVVETAVDAIVTIDDRGMIRSVNPATERMFGYAAAELIGQNIKILMPSPYREEHDSYLARHIRTGEKHIIGIGREVEGQRKDGTVFEVDLAVSEVEPRKLFTGIIRDASERKLGESKLRQSDRMATIGTLAAGLGHDMNNVLLPVRAHVNALRAQGKAGAHAAARPHVEAIAKSVTYLQQLADGLHFLAMDPDKEGATEGATELAQWWSQAGPIISKAVPKHVAVTVSLPASLPKPRVAPHRLTQAILNLVVNAGDAIPAVRENIRGRVHVWAEADTDAADGGQVRVGVTDNGTGMSEEVKRRAFDLFFTTKPRGLGTGLGLSLVQRVAQSAGGAVEIDSTVGKGTTVVMRFPTKSGHKTSKRDQPTAVVTLRDGRAAALIGHVLEASGARLVPAGTEPIRADIWVLDPTEENLRGARAWRSRRPHGDLLLLGSPTARSKGAWGELRPLVVTDRNDFDAVRNALGRAIAHST